MAPLRLASPSLSEMGHIVIVKKPDSAILEIVANSTTVKSNTDACIRIMEYIHQILCAIINLDLVANSDMQRSSALLHDFESFTETLHRIHTLMTTLQRMGKIKQIVKQFDHAAQLESSTIALQDTLDNFKIRNGISIVSDVAHMERSAKQQHEELLAFLADHPESTVSDSVSDAGNLSLLNLSSVSLAILPGRPKIFHGREKELDHVVHILLQDAPRISILGMGGMGKTSLATAALHHPEVSLKYSNRYFIGCHSTPSCTELLSTIGAHIGIDKGLRLAQRIYGYFLHSPPSLLVLDNLETPWESSNSRLEVEEFLSLLADIPHLAVLVSWFLDLYRFPIIHTLKLQITMRGSERPGNVKWTRPFLEPLKPLPDSAALETFLAIADARHTEDSIRGLLHLTGNLPLAVTLMASVAAYEGCEASLARWNVENTQLLSDGYDQRSSLDISIMLSFSSARMTPAAQDLLAVLSLLPDGFSEADIIESNLPIPNIFTCKATLIRTALAYIDKTGRLKTLIPIQEHIRRIHPLPQLLRVALRQHFHEMLEAWIAVKIPSSNDINIVAQLSSLLGNFNAVLLDGLKQDDPDIVQTMQSILCLNRFFRRTQGRWAPPLLTLGEKIQSWRDTPIYGKYLIERLISCENLCPLPDAETHIDAGNQYFEAGSDLDKGNT
ncbi:P-loop containing nucleoside triphosphate hydrolase protein [Mycena vulgaris]|nr:P-loop containing nucleoside triphosphate hydrolase protein [Mycena vulgaris]